jgi:LmbE family N-acetylglucosaminyl deacetylase
MNDPVPPTPPPPELGRRILILIPHPDDEVVGCAAAIGRARAAGAAVYGLYLTTGVPAREALWFWQRGAYAARVERRRAEARAAAERLGLAPVVFREIPARALRTILREARELALAAIVKKEIDTVWAPAYEGGHQDHDAANALASTLAKAAPGLRVLEFAEYNCAGGAVRTQAFPAPEGTESSFALTGAEAAHKREVLALYPSERGNLNYVRAERESFRPLAAYDYGRPPHPGRLFCERFQWVPFRHPRVDFTPHAEVRRAIAEFLAGS